MSQPSSLLDPVLVARLASMELRARAVVEGALTGRHRSKRLGRALEFSGHRPYTPSDDWRRIDWRAYARTDRFAVREQEEESNRRVFLMLDASASMGFHGPGRVSKARCAAMLLAALGYDLLRRGESVGGGVFAENLSESVPERAGRAQLPQILDLFERAAPSGGTGLARALDEAAARLGRRTWVVLASDFWPGDESVFAALRRLRARRHEVSVLWPLDPLETELSLDGDCLFKDLETGSSLRASPDDIRESYRVLARERLSRFKKALAAMSIPAVHCPTHRPLDESLRVFLESAS